MKYKAYFEYYGNNNFSVEVSQEICEKMKEDFKLLPNSSIFYSYIHKTINEGFIIINWQLVKKIQFSEIKD